jgi:rhodanese-related sulfurtransferase
MGPSSATLFPASMDSAPVPASTLPTPKALQARVLQQRLLAGEDLQLVDVREDEELVLAQVAHAVIHLPLSRSQEWLGGIDTLLDAQRPVAVLCHAGVRSWHFGCWLLQERGFREVWNLVGGIDAWSVEVDPAVPRY